MLAGMNITHAEHLPVVASFMEKMELVDTINAAVATEMVVDPGTVVKLMVLDTLSGRSPLYRLEMFAESIDTGLLLRRVIPSTAFNDTTLGRVMDVIYEAGTSEALLPGRVESSDGLSFRGKYTPHSFRHYLCKRVG